MFEKCGHVFCKTCVKESLRFNILQNALDRLICPEVGCGERVSSDELITLFAEDDIEILRKLKEVAERQKDEIDPYVRFCPKETCSGMIRVNSLSVSSV